MIRPIFIAEATSHHGGDIKLAKRFVRAASSSGADFIKFHSWKSKNLMRDDDWQKTWIKTAELSESGHKELIEESQKHNIKFLSTPFDVDSLLFFASLKLDTVKIASFDLSNRRLIIAAADNFENIILSTGLHSIKDIEDAMDILKGRNVILLHCVSCYPTPNSAINLARIRWLSENFNVTVGFSDHTIGLDAAKIAIALGAAVIERHFCLSRNGPGRVFDWDSTPQEFRSLVEYSNFVSSCMGESHLDKNPAENAWRDKLMGRFK